MEEGDDNTVAADLTDARNGLTHAVLVEGLIDAAVKEHTLPNAEDLIPADQRRRAAREQIVRIGHLEPGHFEHVFECRRREEAEVDALALDDRIDPNRRAVGEIVDFIRRDAVSLAERRDAVDHFLARPVRSRQHFECMHRSRFLVKDAEIRERAANIYTYSVCHGSDCLSAAREVKPRSNQRRAKC